MDLSTIMQLLFLALLIFLSGFFSASETALLSLSKIRIRHMVDDKVKGAQLVHNLVAQPSKLLGAILVGNNLVNIAASAMATSLAIRYFAHKGVGIATGIMTLLILIFAEVTPKSLAAQNSEKVALRVAKTLHLMTILFSPVIVILIHISDAIIRVFGGKINKEKPFITEEEFMTIVSVGHEEGVLEVEEKQMIHNIVEFGDSQVKDIMTPRTDMVAVSVTLTYGEVLNTFKEEGFSRMPVYEDTTDNMVGILYIKDLIFLDCDDVGFDARQHLREAYFTYEFKRTSELFKEMRKARVPIAIVLDEYGGTAGIVTIEDLVEEIVGEIEDEYDEDKEDIQVIREDEYIVNGSVRIDDINEMLGTHIESEDFDSIGGFVTGQLGRLPQDGEVIVYNGTKIIVQEVNKNRIEKLKIHT